MCYSNKLLTLLTLGILFSTAVRAVVVAKLVMLGILFLTTLILTLRTVVKDWKLVIIVISFLKHIYFSIKGSISS